MQQKLWLKFRNQARRGTCSQLASHLTVSSGVVKTANRVRGVSHTPGLGLPAKSTTLKIQKINMLEVKSLELRTSGYLAIFPLGVSYLHGESLGPTCGLTNRSYLITLSCSLAISSRWLLAIEGSPSSGDQRIIRSGYIFPTWWILIRATVGEMIEFPK